MLEMFIFFLSQHCSISVIAMYTRKRDVIGVHCAKSACMCKNKLSQMETYKVVYDIIMRMCEL